MKNDPSDEWCDTTPPPTPLTEPDIGKYEPIDSSDTKASGQELSHGGYTNAPDPNPERSTEKPPVAGDEWCDTTPPPTALTEPNVDKYEPVNKQEAAESENQNANLGGYEQKPGSTLVTKAKSNGHIHEHSNKEIHEDSHKEIHEDSNKEIHKDSNKEIHKDSNKEINEDSNKEIHEDSNKEIHEDSNEEMYQDSNEDIYQDSNEDIYQDSNEKIEP